MGIAVIGNGGINSALDVGRMFERTGCDFAMIGTSAIIHPSIFLEANGFLRTSRLPGPSRLIALARFLRHYSSVAGKLESTRVGKFGRHPCRDFLRMRSAVRKIKAGKVRLD